MIQTEVEQYLLNLRKKELPLIIPRQLSIPKTKKIKVIIGPRRAGKTFFLYQLQQKLIQEEKINPWVILHLNFENTKLLETTYKDIQKIIELDQRLFPVERKKIIFLDEPQNITHWEMAVRELFDEGYDIFISGSSSKLLSKEIATNLRGRSLSYLLLPFSFLEFLRTKNFLLTNKLNSTEKNELLALLEEYSEYGGFPEIILENNKEIKEKTIENYFELTVYKDIVERNKIKDSLFVKWFLKAVTSSYSKELSLHQIYLTLKSQGRKIPKDDIYTYASMVNDSLYAFYLPKFSWSIRKNTATHKIYLCDTGFAKISEGDKELGKKLENLVFLELTRKLVPFSELSYWKNIQQEEVDFVIKEKQKVQQLIQVCFDPSNIETKKREIKALLKAGKELKCKNLLIITFDYEKEEIGEWFDLKGKIIFLPFWKWLMALNL